MVENQQLPTYDKNLISSYVKKSKAIRDARYTDGVSFETNEGDGDCLYINIKGDAVSDLFYIVEIIQNDKNCFLVTVNSSRYDVGVVTETLDEAIVQGKKWADNKQIVTLLQSTLPSPGEIAIAMMESVLKMNDLTLHPKKSN